MSGIFLSTLAAVALMLAVAVPGYVLIRRKTVGEECIPALSKILLYVCQPCLATYTFLSSEFSYQKLIDIAIFAGLVLLIHAVMLGSAYLMLRGKYEEPIYRIITIATSFSNCAFFGIPIIEALFPGSSGELIIYTTVYAVMMNIIGWTAGAAIISGNRKYISVKKVFINPAVIGLVIALVLYVCRVEFPTDVMSMITAIARMATPLSMLIIGMRLATVSPKSVFSDIRIYPTLLIKQAVMPLIALAILLPMPFISAEVKQVLFIMCACPVASVVLNFAEIVGAGQKQAANAVLLSTVTSVITLPLVMLLLPVIA